MSHCIFSYGGFQLGEIDPKAMNASNTQNAKIGVDRVVVLINEMAKNLSINVNTNTTYINDPFDQNRTASSVIKTTLGSLGTIDNVKVGFASFPLGYVDLSFFLYLFSKVQGNV